MSIPAILYRLTDFALPPRCPVCGVTVEADNRFCLSCWRQLDFIIEPWCAACGLPLAFDTADDSLCGKCLDDPPAHDGVRAVVRYDDQSSLIAMRLKYGTRLGLAKLIAEHLQKFVTQRDHGSLIVPVPLHRTRLWRRGFNQSVLIGRELAQITGIAMDYNSLTRRTATPPLKGLTAPQRRKTVDAAFALRSTARSSLAEKSVLLIDDVYTSGSTANACSRMLKGAGAEQVLVYCWARVIRGSDRVEMPAPTGIA